MRILRKMDDSSTKSYFVCDGERDDKEGMYDLYDCGKGRRDEGLSV